MNKMTPLKIFAVASIISLPLATQAQIKTDGSLGRPAQTLSGPDFVVPQSLGKLSGGNLFHSFQTFNINSGESATFTTASAGINNVLSRVTGGSSSLINGPLSLKAASGTPNFYFINPAGVTFGAGASIDVPGAFHVSTADYLKFPDGNFYADTSSGSTFSSADPVAFGFLGTSRGSVVVKDGAMLVTNPSQSISIVSGDIEINQGMVITEDGGDIRLLALGKQVQEVGLTGTLPQAEGNLSFIDADIWSATRSTTNGGSVKAGGGSMVIDSARVYSEAGWSTGNAGEVEVAIGGQLTIWNSGLISSRTFSAGKAGSVAVSAGSLMLENHAQISSLAGFGSTGSAGNVDVDVKDHLEIRYGSSISTNSYSLGSAGSVKVAAGSLLIDGVEFGEIQTGIMSDTLSGTSSNVGSVDVAVRGHVEIINGGRISTSTDESGDAGKLMVSAGSLMLNGGEISSVAYSFSTGNAGNVDVNVKDHLDIRNGSSIGTDSYSLGLGNAGSIKVAAGSLSLENNAGISSFAWNGTGNAGNVDVDVKDRLDIRYYSLIGTNSFSKGNAGSVKVAAGSLLIDGGESIETGIMSDARLRTSSSAGNVEVAVRELLAIKNSGQISSETNSSGDAGSVKVSAGSLMLENSGHISSDTWGDTTGNAGTVDVAVRDHLTVNGGMISSNTYVSGDAGRVKVNAGSLTIIGGGISSKAEFGTGNAGSVEVAVRDFLTIKNLGEISTNTYSSGDAGSVEVAVAGQLTLQDSGTISSSSSTYASGNAGSVKVNAGSLMIDGGAASEFNTGIMSDVELSSTGNAGDVVIKIKDQLTIQNGGQISSSTSGAGKAGSVKVSAGSLIIDGGKNGFQTGILSQSEPGSSGHAGSVEVEVTNQLNMQNGGQISTSNFSIGGAGSVKVSAGSLIIDGGMNGFQTGILSLAHPDSAGDAGSVDVAVKEQLTIQNGGKISSSTSSVGYAGSVKVSAGSLMINSSGILSQSEPGSLGHAGSVEVEVTNQLSMQNGGQISTSNFSIGGAGSVKVSAGSLMIESESVIWSVAGDGFIGIGGNSGSVDVAVRDHLTVNGGKISSNTYASGDAGRVKVNAGSLTIIGGGFGGGISSESAYGTGNAGSVEVAVRDFLTIKNFGEISTNTHSSGDAGSVEVAVAGQLTLQDSGTISSSSSTYASGNAGSVKVNAGSLMIDGGAASEFNTGILSDVVSSSTGNAGDVVIKIKDQLTIQNGGKISSSTSSAGKAGSVNVSARSLLIDGWGGVMSDALLGSTGNAGSVEVAVREHLTIKSFGQISSDTFSSGDAGSVKVSAGSLMLEDYGYISSDTWGEITGGNAGNVDVAVTDHLGIRSGGFISSSSYSFGNAGSVKVNSGSLAIDGSTTDGGGEVDLYTGIFSENLMEMSNSGNVDLTVRDHLTIKNFGRISSSTSSSGNGGSVKVRAGSLTMLDDGDQLGSYISSDTSGSGNAGSVDVAVINHLLLIDGAHISSDTYSSGNAGSVKVSAGVLTIDGGGGNLTGIYSDATTGSSGNAGGVEVATSQLSIQNGGWISSSTLASGKGGAIHVQANTIHVTGDIVAGQSGIKAAAEFESSGQTGNVSVTATDSITLTNGGIISISNAATVNAPEAVIPGTATVSSPHVELRNGEITAASTGNVSASNISVNFAGQLSLENSSITTSANLGNAGSIYLRGGNLLTLERSQITTSVLGLTGNGGDIQIAAQALVMNSGSIQANTAAANAIGGNVQVNVDTLLPSGNTLFVGGQTAYRFMPEIFGFNVIQAAAPTGISGAINVMAPVLDISGSLNGLSAKVIDGGKLGRNPCQATGGSSLAVAGRGGSAESARGWLGSELSPIEFLPGGANVKESTRKMSVNETGCRHL